MRTTMRNAVLLSLVAVPTALLGVSLLAGCATKQTPRAEALSAEEFRTLHPRQYLDSLNPWERREEESRLMAEEVCRAKKP